MAAQPTDLHRVFIQTMLARRYVRDEVALELYRRAVNAVRAVDADFNPNNPMDKEGLRAFVGEVNEMLHDFRMSIQRGREETKNGKGFMVLVNTEPDKISENATDLTPAQLGYFRELVGEIMYSYPANSIGRLQALRLATEQEPKIAKSVGQTYLAAFVNRGWLAQSARGRFTLAPRGLIELQSYLATEYKDQVKKCCRCKKMLLTGKACATRNCDTFFHDYCISGLARPSCPSCSVSFAEVTPAYIGEKAVPRTEDDFKGRSQRKQKRRANGGGDEDDDESEEDEEEPSQNMASQTQNARAGPSQRAPSRQKRSRPSVIPETQLDDSD